ncbi:hypothetical protein GPL17_03615 [Bradyrhizobium yuanmingense]|uniref:hypothetical protein n=1 Tax=Bradyrhizobium yuanmingense TaxID=108015 RepID=UPI0012FA08DC|nr:hypothetical protein [Bradyrhizobium yuanmingense]MDF0492013.1 hypothetical protein [Bradyrhizobium yuanmingense]MVT49569.1 hypothetical protein [Bradyrhizobium yuanmingense]
MKNLGGTEVISRALELPLRRRTARKRLLHCNSPLRCAAEARGLRRSGARWTGAGTTLPLIVFAVGLANYNYRQDRSEAARRVLETVRSMRMVLDAEVQRITGACPCRAASSAL